MFFPAVRIQCRSILCKGDLMKKINLKRIYAPPAKNDGCRILIDRLWPRGIKKEDAKLSFWFKDIAPGNELRKWFGHRQERFPEFRLKYKEELRKSPEKILLLEQIIRLANLGTVTLLYAARDTRHNHAVVLREELLERMKII